MKRTFRLANGKSQVTIWKFEAIVIKAEARALDVTASFVLRPRPSERTWAEKEITLTGPKEPVDYLAETFGERERYKQTACQRLWKQGLSDGPRQARGADPEYLVKLAEGYAAKLFALNEIIRPPDLSQDQADGPSRVDTPAETIPQTPTAVIDGPEDRDADSERQGIADAGGGEMTTSSVEANSYPDELPQPDRFPEGARHQVTVNAYERNPKAREQCIEHYGWNCSIRGLNFEQTYGGIGKGFIHVHHLRGLAELGEEYEVDPIEDLRPVCPNCHAMLHQRRPAYSIGELHALLRGRNHPS